MKIINGVLFFLITIESWAVVLNCKSNDPNGLLIEINDSGEEAVATFSRNSGQNFVKTIIEKNFQVLDNRFQLSKEGEQIVLIEKKQSGFFSRNRLELKLNCSPAPLGLVCKSVEGKTQVVIKNDPNLKTPLFEITKNLGLPNQSFARSASAVNYLTTLGMELILQSNGTAVYSGNKRKGAIIDAKGLTMECR